MNYERGTMNITLSRRLFVIHHSSFIV